MLLQGSRKRARACGPPPPRFAAARKDLYGSYIYSCLVRSPRPGQKNGVPFTKLLGFGEIKLSSEFFGLNRFPCDSLIRRFTIWIIAY